MISLVCVNLNCSWLLFWFGRIKRSIKNRQEERSPSDVGLVWVLNSNSGDEEWKRSMVHIQWQSSTTELVQLRYRLEYKNLSCCNISHQGNKSCAILFQIVLSVSTYINIWRWKMTLLKFSFKFFSWCNYASVFLPECDKFIGTWIFQFIFIFNQCLSSSNRFQNSSLVVPVPSVYSPPRADALVPLAAVKKDWKHFWIPWTL